MSFFFSSGVRDGGAGVVVVVGDGEIADWFGEGAGVVSVDLSTLIPLGTGAPTEVGRPAGVTILRLSGSGAECRFSELLMRARAAFLSP